MNREVCLVVCFLLGMLIYHILKGVCGCDKVVEGIQFGSYEDSCTEDADCHFIPRAVRRHLPGYQDNDLTCIFGWSKVDFPPDGGRCGYPTDAEDKPINVVGAANEAVSD